MHWLTEFARAWYEILSQWSNWAGEPLQHWMSAQSAPAVSSFLLGLLGGLAPCQVSANAGAIAYVTRESGDRGRLWRTVRDFLGGKVVVYVALGLLAALLGLRLPPSAMAVIRRLNGPLMVLVGLCMAGLIRWNGHPGGRVAAWLEERMDRRASPPFWLGVAFSLGFCPTMAMIFFGALVPIVVQAQAGVVLPAVFAVGTAVPVILWSLALTAGRSAARRWVRGARSADRYIRWVAALIFLLVGLNDTLLYWLL